MTLPAEIVIGIVLFTLLVVPGLLKDPLGSISDYPPEIRQRCVELGLIGESKKRFTKKDLIKKSLCVFS